MGYRENLTLLPVILASVAACADLRSNAPIAEPAAERLNIVLIVADDLGVNDLSLSGNPEARTPNIDMLAGEGVQYSHAYATSPVCTTSRAALMTGRYQQRFGVESNPSPRALALQTFADDDGAIVIDERADDPAYGQRGLPPTAVTVAERLRSAGYRTALFGKWHLGQAPGFTPNDQGFDHFFGFLGGASMFAERDDAAVVGARLDWNGLDNFLWGRLRYNLQFNGEEAEERGYQTDVFAEAAARFISGSTQSPFFVTVAFNAPHNPLQAPQDYYDTRADIEPHHRRVYYSMVDALDDGVGTILEAIERAGLSDRTLVIFTSDNGGARYIRVPEVNAPLRGFKATFWDGGIRVPLIVRDPGVSESPRRVDQPVSLLDIVPTIMQAAGLEAEGDMFDGSNLFDQAAQPDRLLFWRNNSLWAVRRGDWKLIRDERRNRSWLYNLVDDPNERNDLSARFPDRVAELTSAYSHAVADMPERTGWAPNYLLPVRADPHGHDSTRNIDDWIYWAG